MSTQLYSEDQQATTSTSSASTPPRQQGGGRTWFRIWAVVIGTAVAGALVALAATGLSHSHSSRPDRHAGLDVRPAQPTTPAHDSPAQPTTPVNPSTLPPPGQAPAGAGSAELLRGSDDGVIGPQTVAAIKISSVRRPAATAGSTPPPGRLAGTWPTAAAGGGLITHGYPRLGLKGRDHVPAFGRHQ